MNARTDSESAATRSKPSKGFGLIELIIMVAILAIFIALFLPAVRRGREPARRSQCRNNLMEIALALHNYADEYHALPPAYTVDADGKPLHSWRTLILPYLDQKPLYDRIDLTKPWNDPVNAEAARSAVYAYQCPSTLGPKSHTTYLAVVTSSSCIRRTQPRLLSEITDDHSETVMLIEVDSEQAVPWMAPQDADEALLLAFGPKGKHAHVGGIHAAFVDGRVRFLHDDMPQETRRALISIAGKESLPSF